MKRKIILFVGSVLAFALTFTLNFTVTENQPISLSVKEVKAQIIHTSYGSVWLCPNQTQYMVLCLGYGAGCTPYSCDDEAEIN